MTTYFVIDTRTGEIIAAIMSDRPRSQIDLGHFTDHEHLRLDANPPREVLQRYRYWNERP